MFAAYEWVWNLTNAPARHLASVVDTHCVIVYMTVSDQPWDTITVHSWIGVCTVCTLGWSWCRGHREWLCCARSYWTRCAEWPGVWQFGCWFRCCYWSCAIGSPETLSCNRPKPPSADCIEASAGHLSRGILARIPLSNAQGNVPRGRCEGLPCHLAMVLCMISITKWDGVISTAVEYPIGGWSA